MISKKIILHYDAETVDKPIIYHLVKDFNMMVNVFKAAVNPDKEGYIAFELSGGDADFAAGMDFLRSLAIRVESFAEGVSWNKELCTQCGACTGVCPSGALSMKRPEMNVEFAGDKCVVCGMCIKACPVKAISLCF
ncbi:MAG: 4Fe-4S binding protein [Clostridiales bacterium]|nr:4Fe-4S binding protein [Clostridiales bacterium]